eukprot:5268611-Amphidinium_carterae.1
MKHVSDVQSFETNAKGASLRIGTQRWGLCAWKRGTLLSERMACRRTCQAPKMKIFPGNLSTLWGVPTTKLRAVLPIWRRGRTLTLAFGGEGPGAPAEH